MESEAIKILAIIKNDNVKEFDRIVFKRKNLCLGRFPILSIAYLYGAQGIYSKFQGKLLSPEFAKYTTLEEPDELYTKFKNVAGKCLRFYLNEIVEPTEMLALLGKSELLTKIWIYAPKTPRILQNISSIYSINHNVDVEVSENSINVPRIKGSKSDQKKYLHSAVFNFYFVLMSVCFLLVYFFIVGIGTNSLPYIAKDNFTGLSNSGTTTMKKNLTINEAYSATDFSANIKGNNNTLFLEKLPLFNDFSGTLEDLSVVVELDTLTLKENTAIILTNNGTIKNVNIIFKGSFIENTTEEEIYLSSLVHENNGLIENCTAFVDITISGDGNSNAYFASMTSINNGEIKGCTLKEDSKIIADTIDICGIASINNNLVDNCSVYGYLYQYSNKSFELENGGETVNYSWNPNVSGISLNNNATIANSSNYAKLEVQSKAQGSHSTYCGGIACSNTGTISNCSNTGTIIVSSDDYNAYVGGIVAVNDRTDGEYGNYVYATVTECYQNGEITLSAGRYLALAGGIAGQNFGALSYCTSITSFSVQGNQAFAGALVGADLVTNMLNSVYYNRYTYQNVFLKTDVAPQPNPIIVIESTETDEYGNKNTTLTPYIAEDKTFYDAENNVFYGNYNFAYDSIEDIYNTEGN